MRARRLEEKQMDEPIIRLRENGPILIQMPVRVVDHLGNEFTIQPGKPAVALCRCGQSATKPFCDGSHKRVGFQAAETAAPKSETPPPTSPAAS
jgi:CDGSH-type Zn-finger protein